MIKNISTYIKTGKAFLEDEIREQVKKMNTAEFNKKPARTDIINYLSERFQATTYLEIGVRNPDDNFNKINAKLKYSVDPGVEFKDNPVDFKVTSDQFFEDLRSNAILKADIKFDIIFIDGLHTSDQVYKDVKNALDFISEDGFIVLHDCNPPSEWHARENFNYTFSPAGGIWNGTAWKAFCYYRNLDYLGACCIDSDWGIGVLTKKHFLQKPPQVDNPFYEFKVFAENRKNALNLISFEQFQSELNA